MPERKLELEIYKPETETTRDAKPPISVGLMIVVEQMFALMGADGAAIALRHSQDVRCVASIGDAPAVGSRLELHSDFTRECLESGTVMLCDDAEEDSRIRPSIARILHLRSAVAVPIQAQGSVVGVVEVFSSRRAAFNAMHVSALQQIAELLAPVSALGSVRVEQPVADRCALISGPEIPSYAEDRSGGQQSATPHLLERLVDSRPPTIERRSASSVAWLKILQIGGYLTRLSDRFARKTTIVLAWLVAAATLSLLLLLFLVGRSHFASSKTISHTVVLPTSWPIRSDARDRIEVQDRKNGNRSLGGVSPPAGLSSSSQAAKDKSSNARSPKLSQAPEDYTVVFASRSPDAGTKPDKTQPDSAPPVREGRDAEALTPASLAPLTEEVRLIPFELPVEPAVATILTPAVPPLKSVNSSLPDFVLDRTFKGHSGWVTGVAFSSDGQRLASGSWDKTVKFWDVATGQELSTVGSKMKEVQALALSRDGRWLAAENSSNTVTLWDAATSREIRTLPNNKSLGALGSTWVYSIAFSPDGRWLASGVDDKTVRLWDVATGNAVRDLTALRRSVIYAAFSPDGHWIASGDDDKGIRIWDVSTGQEIRRLSGHKKPIYAIAFSPNGHLLASASADKTVKLWDTTTGRELHTLTGHGNVVSSLAFSPDGRWLASGSWDKTIKIWNVETGHEVQTLSDRDHSIYTVAFDSRGQWLASGSEDGTIQLWRLSRAGD